MISTVEYENLPNCVEISNGEVNVTISTDVGPRILFYGFDGGDNILGWHPQAEVNTALGKWKPYGGHRLWRAPENMPLSYAPDNDPVRFAEEGELAARFTPQAEPATQLQKEMLVTLAADGSGVTIDHTITYGGDGEVEIAAWALTIMRPGGEVLIPNEQFEPYGPETLLPVRTMALWPYTDFTDPRWKFEKDHIRLKVDDSINTQQKVGVLNRQGRVTYEWENLSFTKKFEFVEGADLPDMNSNTEVYTDGGFVEIETLSPLKRLRKNGAVRHTEYWELAETK